MFVVEKQLTQLCPVGVFQLCLGGGSQLCLGGGSQLCIGGVSQLCLGGVSQLCLGSGWRLCRVGGWRPYPSTTLDTRPVSLPPHSNQHLCANCKSKPAAAGQDKRETTETKSNKAGKEKPPNQSEEKSEETLYPTGVCQMLSFFFSL